MSASEGDGSGDKASKKKEPQEEDDSTSENSKKKKNNRNTKETENLEEDKLIGDDDVTVPEGWSRKVVFRKSGKTCGRSDVYFFSPEGQKFRSRTEIASHLADTNSSLQIDDFIFTVRTKASNDIPKEKPKKRKAVAKSPSKAKKGKEDARSTVGKKSPRKFFAELTPPKDTNRTTVAKKQPKRIFVKLFASPKKRILSDFANESHGEEEEAPEDEEETTTKAKARSPPKRGQAAKKSTPPKAKPKGKPSKPATRVLASPKKGRKRKGAKSR